MANTTLEQMLESLLNDDQAKAEELFHDYVVNRSRDIYENLIETELEDDDEEVDEDSKKNEDDTDEELDENFNEFADDGADAEFGGDPTDDLEADLGDEPAEFGDDEEREPSELFQDLESIVDELQAKFDAIAGDGEFGDEEFGDEEFGDEEGGAEFGGDEEEEFTDSFDQELATVREYVEKIGAPKMGDNGANTKSTVAGKNDMGGTSANILKGGEAKGEGTKGGLADPTTKEENAGNINVPGGKAGKAFTTKEPGHGAEKKGAAENADNKQSLFRNKR